MTYYSKSLSRCSLFAAFPPRQGWWYGSSHKLGLVTDVETGGDTVAHTQEMGVVRIEGADRLAAGLKAEALIITRCAQNKQRLAFDLTLPQGKPEQFRAHPLLLEIGCHGHGRQVQTADLPIMIGRGKGDVGNGLVDMKADPFMHNPAVLVEFLHQFGFVVTAGKGALQQGVDLGTVLD